MIPKKRLIPGINYASFNIAEWQRPDSHAEVSRMAFAMGGRLPGIGVPSGSPS
jgi:hypothetical protein